MLRRAMVDNDRDTPVFFSCITYGIARIRTCTSLEGPSFTFCLDEVFAFDAASGHVHKPEKDHTKDTTDRDSVRARLDLEQKCTNSANRNAKGMLLFEESSMIAEETNGPMKADVFPTYKVWLAWNISPSISLTTENNAKKRNL